MRPLTLFAAGTILLAIFFQCCPSAAPEETPVASPPTATQEPTETQPTATPTRVPPTFTATPQALTGTPTTGRTEARVALVIDGDTIEVEFGGHIYRVRYIGMNTPETDQPGGSECAEVNRQLVEAQIVQLEKDVSETDRYGRLLRYVYIGDLFVNAELVRRGYAQAATYPPDVKYSDLFVQLEQEARSARRGLWAPPVAVPSTPTAPPASPPTGQANVQITHIYYDGQVYRVESDEYVEITNLSTAPQDLGGWRLADISEGYPSFTFPPRILGPGESCRVYTNEIHPEYCGFSFGYGSSAVWNNSAPDVAALYDAAGNEVSRRSY